MAKLVLIALADRANDAGECWPSVKTIAEDCECGTTVVKRCLNHLEKLGLIQRFNRTDDGMKQSNKYRINIDSREATNDSREATKGRARGVHKTPIETPISYLGPEAFQSFWTAYPRKTSKAQGEKAFHKHVKDEQTLEAILANVEARLAAGEWTLQRKNFIPHPATYLNGQRWLDEVITNENYECHVGTGEDSRRLSAVERTKLARRSARDRVPRA